MLPRLGARRDLGRVVVQVGLGVGFFVLGIWAVLVTLSPRDSPKTEPIGVALVSPVPVTPRRGFLTGLDVRVRGCERPVDALLTLQPSSEFWSDHARSLSGKPLDLTIAIGDERLIDPVAVAGTDSAALRVSGERPQLLSSSVSTTRSATVVRMKVSGWATTQGAVSVRFRARWLSPRSSTPFLGFRTCYLQLPHLVGPTSLQLGLAVASPAEEAAGRAFALTGNPGGDLYQLSDNITVGATLVQAPNLDSGSALPPPTSLTPEGTRWSCTPQPLSLSSKEGVGDVTVSAGGGTTASAAWLASVLAGGQQECATLAVVREGGVDAALNIVLIVVGMLLSLGLQYFGTGLKVLTDMFRSRPSEG